jgi:plasmid stability protein
MPNLLVRNIDEGVVSALKIRAGQHGISAEAEHRAILESALMKPRKKSFVEILGTIPNVGNDADFERIQDDKTNHVFD